jgi:hypothetical protein
MAGCLAYSADPKLNSNIILCPPPASQYLDVLPAVFDMRRGNRGLENVAVSPDGKTAVTLMQSPMGEQVQARTLNPWPDERPGSAALPQHACIVYLAQPQGRLPYSIRHLAVAVLLPAARWAASLLSCHLPSGLILNAPSTYAAPALL